MKTVLFSRLHARFAVALLALFAAAFGLLSPLFQKLFIDRLMGVKTGVGVDWLVTWPAYSFIALAFVALLLGSLANVYAVWVGAREGNLIQARLGELLYGKMLRMRTDQLGNRPVGEVVALYATDVQGATLILEEALPMATSTLFPLIFAPLAVHAIADVPLWATIALSTVIVCLNLVLARRQSRFFYFFKQLAAERVGIVAEWIQNMRLLRILGWTQSFEAKIQSKRIEETANRISMVTNGQFMSSIGSSVSFFINLCGIASLIFLSKRTLNPGELLALLWIFGVFLSRPFRQIPWMFTMAMDGMTSIRRLELFLNGPDEGESFDLVKTIAAPSPASLMIKDLSLNIGPHSLLKNIDLSVAAGEWVAIVGEVGSGKTLLLLSLMAEAGATFRDYEINGESILDWSVDKRRALFAFVPQEGFVMSASMRENVALEYEHGIENDARILESLTKAQFDATRESVSGGLGAEIGERGVNLSGGQRQRVSLARAEYFSRPILLLDDCLSAVDIETERKLVENLLDGSWRGRTRVLVTHRLTVLEHVDRVVFLEDGRIEAIGTLKELLRTNEKFRAFAATVVDLKPSEPPLDRTAAAAQAQAEAQKETEDLGAET